MRKRFFSHLTGILTAVLVFLALATAQRETAQGPSAAEADRVAAEPAASERPNRRRPDDARFSATVTRVIDGDTFVLADGQRVRVADFDTPETRGAHCAEERRLGQEATEAARRLLLRQTVDLRVTGRDRYQRLVADVILTGAAPRRGGDFRDRMIAAGHGAVWRYGREPKPDWCGGPAEI